MRFETRYTYDFVKRFLPSGCRRILEVGCGTGELAACLSEGGYSVVAIDSDPDSIVAAQRLGVDGHVATWPDFNEGQFDVILFARSLHHIHPLEDSLRRAADSLEEGGRIIVEDFAYESADEKTLRWFASAIRLLEAAGSLIMSDGFLEKVLSKTATLTAWRENHQNELHTAAQIDAQLKQTFGHVITEDAPYYFRYIVTSVIETARRDAILQAFFEQEQILGASGSIAVLGRRFVAAR